MKKLSIKERWKRESPDLFKNIIRIGLTVGGVGAALLAAPIALPAAVTTAAGYLVTVGSVAAVVSKLTVKDAPKD